MQQPVTTINGGTFLGLRVLKTHATIMPVFPFLSFNFLMCFFLGFSFLGFVLFFFCLFRFVWLFEFLIFCYLMDFLDFFLGFFI